MVNKPDIKDKPTLTIEEASALYNIGEHKLREISDADNCNRPVLSRTSATSSHATIILLIFLSDTLLYS